MQSESVDSPARSYADPEQSFRGTPRSRAIVFAATLLAPAALGLLASSLLLVDYLRPMPVFCDEGGGCDRVKHTIFAFAGPVPTPAIGIAAFALLGVLALLRGVWARRAHFAIAAGGAMVAVLFLLIQAFLVGAFCTYCCIADGSMIALAFFAWRRMRAGWDPRSLLWRIGAVPALGAVAGLPIVMGMNVKLPVPGAIAKELDQTPRDKVLVVDFVDYECPFCRMTHEELAPVLAAHKDQVRLVRKNVPLVRIHPHAMDAARAACCGKQLGKEDAMAEGLMKTPVEELTPDGCEKLAASLGLSVDAYRACVSDPKTDEAIRADTDLFRNTGGHGLPTIWVGQQKLEGAQPRDAIEHALDAALAKAGT